MIKGTILYAPTDHHSILELIVVDIKQTPTDDDMYYLYTELHSNPVTGVISDNDRAHHESYVKKLIAVKAHDEFTIHANVQPTLGEAKAVARTAVQGQLARAENEVLRLSAIERRLK